MQNASGLKFQKKPHEELCHDFTSTVSALAEDAAALRQLISLRFSTGVELGAITTTGGANKSIIDVSHDDENTHPNMINGTTDRESDRTISSSPNVIENLRTIDDTVTALEFKMRQLHELIMEEKKAISDLEE
eukprot:12756262-Ditylum_brightwellii.AAC.1